MVDEYMAIPIASADTDSGTEALLVVVAPMDGLKKARMKPLNLLMWGIKGGGNQGAAL
jgi:hypothetical protein